MAPRDTIRAEEDKLNTIYLFWRRSGKEEEETLLLMTKPKRKKLADSGDMTRFSPRAGLSSSPAGGLIYVCEFVSYLSDYVLTAFVEGESAGLPSRQKKEKKKQTSMQNTRAHVKCTRTHGSFERPEMSGGNFWPTCFYPYGSDLLVARSAFGIKNNNTLSRNSYSSLHAVPKPLAHVLGLCVHFSFILSNSHQVTSANYTCPAGDSHLNTSINSISRIHIKNMQQTQRREISSPCLLLLCYAPGK